MQRREPFSPGQGLAYGWLIGGVTGAVAILLSFRLSAIISDAAPIRSARLAGLSNLFHGLFAVSLAYALFANDPMNPLMGFSMGAAMAAILHTYTQYAQSRAPSIRTETWAVFAVTIAASVLLAAWHFDATQLRIWWALPILLGTTITVASYVGVELASVGRLRENPGPSHVAAALIAAALVAGLSAVYSWKLFNEWQLLEVVAVGLGIGAIVGWIVAALARVENEASGMEAGAACVLLIVAFAAVAFKLWAGLGIAIGLLAAWTIAIPGLGGGRRGTGARPRDAIIWPFYLVLVIVLYRLFIEKYGAGLHKSDLNIHYTFLSALLGAMLPFVLAASLSRLRQAGVGTAAIVGVGLIGLIAAASPLLVSVLWEARAAMGLSFGLTAATAFMLMAGLSGDTKYCAGLIPVAALLTAIQFLFLLTDVQIARATRIEVLAAVVVLALAWFGLSGVFAARRAR